MSWRQKLKRLPRRLFMPNIGSTNIEAAELETQTSSSTDKVAFLSASSNPKYTLDDWEPRYPDLWEWDTWQQALCMNLHQEDWSQEGESLAEDIWRFRIFSAEHVGKLADEIQSLEQWARKHNVSLQPPNSMHDYGIEMKLLDLDKILQRFTVEIADVIVARLYPEVHDEGLDHHHAFSVTYGKNHNRSLGFHADDSEVTFNFCLGGDFIGSELYFQGRRCFNHMQTDHRPEEHVEVEQIPGTCIVHAGLHRHGVLPILQGERRSLILWTKSSGFREHDGRSECSDWCEK
jgi:hypothetical protein